MTWNICTTPFSEAMETIGVKYEDTEALQIPVDAGAAIDFETNVTRFSNLIYFRRKDYKPVVPSLHIKIPARKFLPVFFIYS